MLKKRKLGETGLEVSELALGGLFISSYGTDADSAKAVVQRAVELGVNYIDTAPGYMDSESVLGGILGGIDAPIILGTKLGYKPEPYRHQDPEFLRRAFDDSLKRLRRDSVDILMIHEPDRPDMADWWSDADACEGPVMDILREAREAGKTRFIGLGGTTVYEMANVIDTGKFDVLLTAFNYDLLWREAGEHLIPNAVERGMGVVCGSPLHQGALAKVYQKDVLDTPAKWLSPPRRKQFAALYEFVNDHRFPLPELAIRFVLSNENVSTALTGVRSIEELESNVAAVEKGPLPTSTLEELDAIAKMVPYRPCLEPWGLPFNS